MRNGDRDNLAQDQAPNCSFNEKSGRGSRVSGIRSDCDGTSSGYQDLGRVLVTKESEQLCFVLLSHGVKGKSCIFILIY